MAEYSLSELLENKNIFIVKRSSIGERFDPKYHIVKKELLSEFKYPLEKIGNSFIVKDGDHDKLPAEAIRRDNQGKRYLRAQDLKDNQIINDNPIYITDDYFNKITRCHIYPGDLLVSIMASLGATAIVPDDYPVCTANRAIGILRQKENGKLLPEYVQVLMNTNLGFALFEVEKKGGIQQRLNLSDITNVQLPTPPNEIQQEIVNRYHEALNNKQQKEKEARDLLNGIDDYLLNELGITLPQKQNNLQSRIFTTSFSEVTGSRFDSEYSQVFYREIRKSAEKCRYTTQILSKNLLFIESGSRPSGGVGNIESGVFSIGGEHVNDKCEVGIGTPKYIPQKFHEKIKNTETQIEDIILVKDGATTGKIGIIDNPEFVKQNINEHVFLLRPDKSVLNPYYLTYFLRSFIGQTLLKREITGATVTGLTKPVVKKIPIPIPEVTIQDKIANHIQELRRNSKEIEISAAHSFEKTKEEIEKLILG